MVLNVHHLESRKTGGNSPDNLITLCETCHNMYHRGLISLDNVTKGSSYKPETFMSILRKYLIENLRKTYNNVSYTYGYETKVKELQTGWRKTTTWIPLHFRKFPGRAGRSIFI